jgi:recombinational DNA repair protein RecT
MNTIAARSGYTVTAGVVRQGDDFEYNLGTGAYARHKPKLGNTARIVGAWAVAEAVGYTPIVAVLSIDEILAVKAKSPGAKKSDSPWNDSAIGFPAMAEKTVRRRLARSMPLNTKTHDFLLAARMEEAFEEQGKTSHLTPARELVIEGDMVTSLTEVHHNNTTPTAETLVAPLQKQDPLAAIKADGHIAAKEGMSSLQIWFRELPRHLQQQIKPYLDNTLKAEADTFDQQASEAQAK